MYHIYTAAKTLYKEIMLVSYSETKYELSGTINTDTHDADFIYTRRPLKHPDDSVLPTLAYMERYFNKIAEQGTLGMTEFEVLEPTMTGSLHESFNLPRVRISGWIELTPIEDIMARATGGLARYTGGPEKIRHDIGVSALQACGRIIMSEFEGFILPRE